MRTRRWPGPPLPPRRRNLIAPHPIDPRNNLAVGLPWSTQFLPFDAPKLQKMTLNEVANILKGPRKDGGLSRDELADRPVPLARL